MNCADAYERGLKDGAKIAEFFALENSRLAIDTWMGDPIRRGNVSPTAQRISQQLYEEGLCHSSMASGASKVAILIRQQIIDGPTAGLASVLRCEVA